MMEVLTFVHFTAEAREAIFDAAARFESLAAVAAALLFILALAGLSRQKTARRGNRLGALGMALALLATMAVAVIVNAGHADRLATAAIMAVAVVLGAALGIYKALRVKMTAMPELVAILHSFVGAAAVFVGIDSFLLAPGAPGPENAFHMGEVGLAVFIGAVTFTGSIIAYLKLSAKIPGRPLALPGRNALNLAMVAASLALIVWFANTRGIDEGLLPLGILTVVALVLGAHLVCAIGGGDMPVVVSMLNSYSGWAAAMAGFTLGNDLLIITGALVGSSGAYLSYIMCKGMNRSFVSVILGGFGGEALPHNTPEREFRGTYKETTAEEAANMLKLAKRVVIAPGYGMAVAQAQFPLADLARKLESEGVDVKFAIHPVAGRMPGHMNVLLAEANVPYDDVLEMDEVNDGFSDIDVVLVIGANDTVNPVAETEPDSPIAGMPVMRVWDAGQVIALKRSMGNAGYAGVDNPLFYHDNTAMLLGDAKRSIDEINASL